MLVYTTTAVKVLLYTTLPPSILLVGVTLYTLTHHKWLHVSIMDGCKSCRLFICLFFIAINGCFHFSVKDFEEPVVFSDAGAIPRCQPRIQEFSIPLEVRAAKFRWTCTQTILLKNVKFNVIFTDPRNTEELSWTCYKVFLHRHWIRILSAGFGEGGKPLSYKMGCQVFSTTAPN